MKEMSINELQSKVWQFGEERPVWRAGQDIRQLAVGIVQEAAELMSCFRFGQRGDIEEELADIFISSFNFAQEAGIDVAAAVLAKLEKMNARYPVESFQEGEFGANYLEVKEMNR